MIKMSKSATVLCLNGKRRTVKFNPNSPISQILDDVCKKENIDPALYDLKTQRNVLDKSLPWRFANLPNNAKLELCLSKKEALDDDSKVQIAVQFENGKRLTSSFLTSTCLVDVLQHFGDDIKRLTQPCSVPSVVYMRQELVGLDELSKTSLRALGILKGNALLRVSFKSSQPATSGEVPRMPTNPQNQMHSGSEVSASVSLTTISSDEQDCRAPKSQSCEESRCLFDNTGSGMSVEQSPCYGMASVDAAVTEQSPAVDRHKVNGVDKPGTSREVKRKLSGETEVAAAKQMKLMEFSNNAMVVEQELEPEVAHSSGVSQTEVLFSQSCDREEIIFTENPHGNAKYDDVSDEFFEVTLTDVRKMLGDLRHENKKLRGGELLTDAQRKARKLELVSRCPKVILRIIFHDRHVLQGNFQPLEKIAAIYDYVRKHVTVKEFYLFTAPPKKILNEKEATLFDSGLCPASRIYFGTKTDVTSGDVIRPASLKALKSDHIPNEIPRIIQPATKDAPSIPTTSQVAEVTTEIPESPETSKTKEEDARLKKLFKLGGKKR